MSSRYSTTVQCRQVVGAFTDFDLVQIDPQGRPGSAARVRSGFGIKIRSGGAIVYQCLQATIDDQFRFSGGGAFRIKQVIAESIDIEWLIVNRQPWIGDD